MTCKYLKLALLALASVMSWVSYAQTREISGKVVDADGADLQFVNVVLLSLPDSTIVTGAMTDEQGMFCLSAETEQGVVQFSNLGYRTVCLPFADIDGQVVRLSEDSRFLEEAMVRAVMPKTKLTGNSMITTIQGTVLSNSGTAHEILSKVPGMTQRDDELEVIGKGKPVFYLNGRKVQDKDELKSWHSSEIQNVEVITNPGALYDATVSAVVRIRTVKTQGEGFGFNVDVGNNQDLVYGYSDPSTTVNMKYRYNSVDVFGMVNYRNRNEFTISNPVQTNWFMQEGQLININQDSRWYNHNLSQELNANLGLNWQISQNHSVGVRVERRGVIKAVNDYTISNVVVYRNTDDSSADYNDESTTDGYRTLGTPHYWTGNAYYNGLVGKLNIDLNVDFVTRKSADIADISETRESGVAYMNNESTTSSDLWAGKLVLSYPVWKGQLQAGTEMSFVDRANHFAMTGYPIPTTESDIKEQNIAGFLNYAFSVEKFGNLTAGLRYEHVGFDYTDILNPVQSISRYTDDFFPSVSWSNQYGKFRTSLAYSARIARPNYSQLSENINYMNSFSLEQGNPKLKNEIIYEVSGTVGYQWLNFFVAYERRDNTLTQGAELYNDKGVIVIRQINLESPLRNVAAFLSASPTFGCYSSNWTIGIQRFFYKQTLLDPSHPDGQRTLTARKPVVFMDLNNAFRFKGSWQLEANLNVVTKGDMMQFAFLRNTYNLGLVVQKCWLKNDALCLRISMSDVLQKRLTEMFLDNGYFQLHQTSGGNYHRLNVTLRYTFNSSNNKYKGSGAGADAKKRM
jgi:hypothetical protein